MFSMKTFYPSPTYNLSQFFVFFGVLNHYRNIFKMFHVRCFDSVHNMKKVTCNFIGLLNFIGGSDYETIYIFGIENDRRVLLFEQDEFGCRICDVGPFFAYVPKPGRIYEAPELIVHDPSWIPF